MKEYNSIVIHWGHDASVSFIDKQKNIRVFEYERFCKTRYATFYTNGSWAGVPAADPNMIVKFLSYINDNVYQKIENIYYSYGIPNNVLSILSSVFPHSKFLEFPHHFSHVCSGYYQSKFKNALVFSLDGGGNDYGENSTYCVYKIINNDFQKILNTNDIGVAVPYRDTSFLLKDINTTNQTGNSGNWIESYGIGLADPGKIMGLCAYGEIKEEWVSSFKKFLSSGGFHTEKVQSLCNDINIPFGFKILEGQLEYDVAATMQETFKRIVFETMKPIIDQENLDVIFVGGCALNVLYNQYLYEYLISKNLKLFIPPNPSDCGITHGFIMHLYPELAHNNPYIGFPILDESNLEYYLLNYPNKKVSFDDIADELLNGKIIGIVQGQSEIGPRALGNRSIICYPSYDNMKDILNKKVKFREWYRPFAPVCKLEDKDMFFENAFESKYMSFAPIVKKEYRKKLASITHIDNTARLQTVTKDYHEFFYNILETLTNKNQIPVILNTSFNIKGKPILTTLEDAFYALDNTQMDYVLYNNILFSKN